MSLFGSSESREEIRAKICNSECAKLFSNGFCGFFSEGSPHLQWLMANSKERMYQLEIAKQGVLLKRIEVSRIRLKQTGSYDVDSEGWGFGASGFDDLPNSKYVSVFRDYLFEQIKNNCPLITFVGDSGDYIKLADNVKQGW